MKWTLFDKQQEEDRPHWMIELETYDSFSAYLHRVHTDKNGIVRWNDTKKEVVNGGSEWSKHKVVPYIK